MNPTNRPHRDGNREQKRAQFASPAPGKTKKNIVVVIALALIGLTAYILGRNLSDQPEATTVTVASTSPAAPAGNAPATVSGSDEAQPLADTGASAPGDILIPISDVSSGQAKFFDYTAGDKTPVRFFVIKSSDGIYRAALDACDVCYRGKKGYRQQGDDMVCQKCGRHFPSALVNEVTGGCNPIAVNRRVSGDKLLIRAADLDSLKTYF